MTQRAKNAEGGMVMYWCPGCESCHGVSTEPSKPNPLTGAKWQWNGSLERPTFEPSVLVHPAETIAKDAPELSETESLQEWADKYRTKTPRCHHYVRDGRIEFLSDCDHALAGKTVDLPDWDQQLTE